MNLQFRRRLNDLILLGITLTMRNSLRLSVLASLFAVGCALVSCSVGESTWDRVQSSAVLRVGLDPTYPPFEFYDGQSLYGIDVDLASAIAAENSLTVKFGHFGFDGLYDALATEQVDVLISALVVDLARTKDFAFSDGYVDSGLVLVSVGSSPIKETADLSGNSVAVELGAASHVQATTIQRHVKNLTVNTYNGSDEALSALAGGEAEAAIVDNISFRLWDSSEPAKEYFVTSLTTEPYAIVVREEDRELLDHVNKTLAALRASGRLDQILDRWLTSQTD